MGDFNVDNINESNKNDYLPLFESILTNNDLHCVDTESEQDIKYTFKTTGSWLDHVMVGPDMFDNINVYIKEDYDSKSDHFPMVIQTSFTKRTTTIKLPIKHFEHLPEFILNSSEFRNKYQENVMAKIIEMENIICHLDQNKHQENIDFMVKNFYDAMLQSINEAKEHRINLQKFQYIRNKSWWSDETQMLFDEKDELSRLRVKSKQVENRIRCIKRQLEAIKKRWENQGIKGNLTKLNTNFYHERTNF